MKAKLKGQKFVRRRRRLYSDERLSEDMEPLDDEDYYDEYGDEDDEDEDEDEIVEELESEAEEIIDQFRKVITMLRDQYAHNNGGLMDQVKESLRKGEHLDELRIEHDWKPDLADDNQESKQ